MTGKSPVARIKSKISTKQKIDSLAKTKNSIPSVKKHGFVKFVQIRLETKADYHEPIELYVAVNDRDNVTGGFPMLGIWGPDNWRSEYCPFKMTGYHVDFGSAFDDPPDSIRGAYCDLIERRIVYGERVLYTEDGGSPAEYRIVSVDPIDLDRPPVSEVIDHAV